MKNKFKQARHNKKESDETDYEGNMEMPKKWYEELIEDPKAFDSVTDQVLIDLKAEAKKCHDSEVASYNSKNAKTNSDYRWMKTIMSKGTVSDKIAAFTVSIQDNPICNLDGIRHLVGMVKVGKKKECTAVMQTLTELFLSDLLKPGQKLKAFHQRPLSLINDLSSGNTVTRRKLLYTWYFEDQLKETYTSFVIALNTAAHDTVEHNKEKSISAMYQLLAGNPEQEKNLLSHIVNKLGDPSQKVASKTIYCLGQLLHKHPNMQAVVLGEVEKMMFRPNIASRAQYYGLCFLSQFYLSHDAPDIARKLIEVYFSFFKACIKKGEVDSRMMSALLMGVNRAYPYAKLELEKISEHINTMYKIVHVANFNVSLHALTLLYQVADHSNNVTDRFYSALYKKLFDIKVTSSTHQAMLLNLIYKALLKDNEVNRIKVFVKRLLQISCYVQPCFACGILYLVSHLIGKKPELQVLLFKKTEFKDDDDEGEEKYEDAKEEITEEVKNEEDTSAETNLEEKEDVKDAEKKAGWVHCSIAPKSEASFNNTQYRPLNRNPMYAGGEFCAYTELLNLKQHYHPSVALFADNILTGNVVKYSGDPLKDFSLIRFLDRFVFKNPKKLEDPSKQGAHPTFGKRKAYIPKGLKSISVNSASYLNENKQNIPVDEVFMFAYLQKKMRDAAERAKDDDGSDLESVASEEFEEMLDKMSGLPKDEEEELDFMNEIGDKLKQKVVKKKGEEDSGDEDLSDEEEDISDGEEMSEGEEMDDNSDIEMEDMDKELIGDLEDDEGLSDISFDSDEETKQTIRKKPKKGKKDAHSLFASAEEFASILEDEGSSRIAPGSSNAVSNKDNANVKQLAWEEKRNRWVRGFNKAVGKKGDTINFKGSKKGGFKKKRPNEKNFGNKNKKRRF